ncbi:Sulfotransferase domain - like 10 [Theobroma cacao]|nr:Sulfotransferase domain - like 10 [Theobroma cacao]
MDSSFPNISSTLLGELPKETWWGSDLYNWEGFWFASSRLSPVMAARSNFQASDDDVFLISSTKTGTTGLKAIIPTIMNPKGRTDDDIDDPLLKHHPNDLMPSLEMQLFMENPNPDFTSMPSPRLSLRRPVKILVLRYEDLKKDPKVQVKKPASFLGRPFAKEEEVDKVLWRCSLERLKNLEVNQNGVDPWLGINYKFHFRRGIVGDWENNITEEMKEKLDQVTRMKFEGSGLDFAH